MKTVQFKNPTYLGDPRNIVKIFNDKDADELVLLDISATTEHREPQFGLIEEIAGESFMPLGYGGGITTIEQVRRIIGIGIEKIVINTAAVERTALITEAADVIGSQSVVVSIDVKKTGLLGGKYEVFTRGGRENTHRHPVQWARQAQEAGAGEILLNSIDQDGTMKGYDLALIRQVADAVSIPVVACGGAGSVKDLVAAVRQAGASAASAGSLFVFQGKHRAVLISFPSGQELRTSFA